MTKTDLLKVKKAIAKKAHIKNIDCIENINILECPEFEGAIVITAQINNEKYEAIFENGEVREVNNI